MTTPRACPHETFVANVDVSRFTADGTTRTDMHALSVEVRVACAECGMPLVFFGAPIGMLPDRPAISPDGTELRVPARPQEADPHFGMGLPGFVARAAEANAGRLN